MRLSRLWKQLGSRLGMILTPWLIGLPWPSRTLRGSGMYL